MLFDNFISRQEKIAIVGLGYVGLPLAVHLAKHFDVVGYDYKKERIDELCSGYDRTLEVASEELKEAQVVYAHDPRILSRCQLIIVAVPTPIDQFRIPDLTPLKSASEVVGKHMHAGSCVVYESTVFPGATEEVCIPILEERSGYQFGKDFKVGYSPERINPGDKVHTFDKIVKVVSGSDDETAAFLEKIYGTVVKAGTHRASSLKVAEAAKVIENTQRDLNIALMNELAKIFHSMAIDTNEVLEAAGTKWNFLPFKPGLVGGHCIGVDPYYLTFKAESMGYHPEMILAGRRINDTMGKYVAERTIKMLISSSKTVNGSTVVILGVTFKENVPDLRNTKVIDIISELEEYGVNVVVSDPMADKTEAKEYYGLDLVDISEIPPCSAVLVAVIHDAYKEMGLSKIAALCNSATNPIVLDLKGAFDPVEAKRKKIQYWRL